MNISMLLRDRELHPFQMRLALENALEDSFVAGNACKFDNPLPPSVSSTIAIAMACDGQTFATTHGDHTVKVFDFISGEQIRVFSGHPRTPWTIKYHPSDPNIVASGCLGFEVRVWHIEQNVCLNMNTYSQTIISLAFHPVGYFIAVACGMSIQLWDWQNATGEIEGDYFPIVPATDTNPNSVIANKSSSMELNNSGGSKSESDEAETEFPVNWRGITHTRNIRAVLFHPSGEYIFAVAPDSPKPASEELAHCKLYACEFSALLNVDSVSHWGVQSTSGSPHSATEINRSYEEDQLEELIILEDPIFPLKLSSCRILIPQIHLYSDGGIDISKDGRYLLTCARVQVPPIIPAAAARKPLSSSILSPDSPNTPSGSVYRSGTGSHSSHSASVAAEESLPPLFNAVMRGAERSVSKNNNINNNTSPSPGQEFSLPNRSPVPNAPSLSFTAYHSAVTSGASSSFGAVAATPTPSSSSNNSSDYLSAHSKAGSQSTSRSPLPPTPGTPTLDTEASPMSLTPPPLLGRGLGQGRESSASPGWSDLTLAGCLGQLSLGGGGRHRDVHGTPMVVDMTAKHSVLSPGPFTTPLKVPISEGSNSFATPASSQMAVLTPLHQATTVIQLHHSVDTHSQFSSYKDYIREASNRKIHQNKLQSLMSRAGQVKGWKTEDHLCVFEMSFTSQGTISKPTLLNSKHLPGGLMKAVTSAKLSGSCRYALVGYGVRVGGQVPDHPRRHAACEVVSVQDENMRSVAVMSDFEDEVNIAQFHPYPGHGIVYGTKRGKIRSFSKA